jgi:hypothetical protein
LPVRLLASILALLNMKDFIKLLKIIQECWGADTSFFKDWKPTNPAKGHCSISALIIQKYFGGMIAYSKEAKHYWNILPDGTILDITRKQFSNRKVLPLTEIRTRGSVLKNRNINGRYRIFEKRIEERLQQEAKER